MKLVIAPHVDDDVIGCGGILDADTLVYYCGVDEFHGVSRELRQKEAENVAARTGQKILYGQNIVNSYQFTALKDQLESLINSYEPEEVLLPWPSYNQDHQTVYDAAMVALRPHDRNYFVKRVLLYEEPDCFWQPRTPFIPNLFRDINIMEKIVRYELMASQLRGHRSPEHILALARIRGAACNLPAAEAYHILRWVE